MNEEHEALLENLNLQADMEELYREAIDAANAEVEFEMEGYHDIGFEKRWGH